jgi:hypothetical protein
MDTPEDRLTLLERAQLLHDATMRRHGEILDRHEDRIARLEALMEQQHHLQGELRAIAEHLAQRQDSHDEVMRHLAQTLDAIKDMLDRGNGH